MSDRPLQDFVEQVSGNSRLRIEHDYGGGFVRLQTSEAARRQAAQDIRCSENIVLELLRNARDAHASLIYLAFSREGDKRLITVIDDGDGIPPSMHELVFEPRVTSKLDTSHEDAWGFHGRGMALFSIAERAEEARVAASEVNLGCSVRVVSDVSQLPEKADQSSFPRFELAGNSQVDVRGPRNILRCACEFAIESRDSCAVITGSPAEIAAALLSYGTSSLSAIDRAFCEDASQLPIVKRLATASDPADFAQMADSIGLGISARTARRVLDGEIAEAVPLLDLISLSEPREEAGKRRVRSSRAAPAAQAPLVKLHPSEADSLAHAVGEAFAPIAERYYLDPGVHASVKVVRGRLTVSVPLVEKL